MRLYICILFLLMTQLSFGQQLPIFTQYQEGDHFTNPALLSNNYFKYDQASTVSLVYRNQWAGLKDAPQTSLGRFEHWNEKLNLSYGGSVILDQTGPTSFMGVLGKIGYGVNINKNWLLSGALSAGMIQYRIKASELSFLEEGDVAQNNEVRIYPDMGVGAVLYYRKKYFIGASVPQVLGLNTSFTGQSNTFDIERVRHYYMTAGTILPIYENWLEISAYSRIVPNVPVLFGGNVRFDHDEMFWIGVGGSSAGAVSVEGGLILDVGENWSGLRIGYGLANYFSDYNVNFGLVHEFKTSFAW